MVGISTHLQVIPQKKNTYNAANLPLQTCGKNQWIFFVVLPQEFCQLRFLCKIFRFLQFIIPWYTALISKSCILLALNCLMGTEAVVVVRQEYNGL